jgi:hypothetical protein
MDANTDHQAETQRNESSSLVLDSPEQINTQQTTVTIMSFETKKY